MDMDMDVSKDMTVDDFDMSTRDEDMSCSFINDTSDDDDQDVTSSQSTARPSTNNNTKNKIADKSDSQNSEQSLVTSDEDDDDVASNQSTMGASSTNNTKDKVTDKSDLQNSEQSFDTSDEDNDDVTSNQVKMRASSNIHMKDKTTSDLQCSEESFDTSTIHRVKRTGKKPAIIDSSSDEEESNHDSNPIVQNSTNASDHPHIIEITETPKKETTRQSIIANKSAAFTTPRSKPAPIILSDSEEDDSNSEEHEEAEENKEENEEIEENKEIEVNKEEAFAARLTMTRMSANFKALPSDLCSTMVGSDLQVEDDSNDVIDLTDDSLMTSPLKPVIAHTPKPTPKAKEIKKELVEVNGETEIKGKLEGAGTSKIVVSKDAYAGQERLVKNLEADLQQINNVFRTVNLNGLTDKGELLKKRRENLKDMLGKAREKFENMIASKEPTLPSLKTKPTWTDIEVESAHVQPKTFGQRALQTYNAQKAVTMERLEQLHGSLARCPTETTLAEDPRGLRVELMPHQKRAVAWLLWRERQRPSGGILADDMGLGKTLTTIALTLKSREERPDRGGEDDENDVWRDADGRDEGREPVRGGSLIVCPASLVKQWEAEVKKHCRPGLIKVLCYHGPKREPKDRVLCSYDMVITTYQLCRNELEKSSPLFRINWRRVILDEGHQIRNHKSKLSIAVTKIKAVSRWVLTGTPIHNKEIDMYSLMKFLHCSPFDDYAVWSRWIANKDTGGYQRLHTVVASLMLRRTKAQLQQKGSLEVLPERTWSIVEVELSKDEMLIYEKVLVFSRTIFAQYLHQRSNKGGVDNIGQPTCTKPIDPNSPYYKLYEKMSRRLRDVKQHEILMVLLRLRQCCCHPSLITKMLERGEFEDDDDSGVVDLMEELKKLDLEDEAENQAQETVQVNTRRFHEDNPLFHPNYKSEKIASVLKKVVEITETKREKVIVVSQWTSFLRVLGVHLRKENIRFEQLDGTMNIDKRMEVVQNINNASHPTKVLFLSLTAGGVGLNLVGANHLLLVDLHWNPQLEMQAQDRIYRLGQKKPVFVYKFVTKNTIEEQIKKIQDHKLSLADTILTGAKIEHTKLSIQDLRLLFNV